MPPESNSPPRFRRCLRRHQSGLTLVELVITIVIVSLALASVVGAFSTMLGRSADALQDTQAVSLAQMYLDEILSRKYDEDAGNGGTPPWTGACRTGAEAGEARGTFDDVDDYQGIDDQPPALVSGSLPATYAGFRVEISVTCAGAEIGLPSANAKRIDVRITGADGVSRLFSAYRGNF